MIDHDNMYHLRLWIFCLHRVKGLVCIWGLQANTVGCLSWWMCTAQLQVGQFTFRHNRAVTFCLSSCSSCSSSEHDSDETSQMFPASIVSALQSHTDPTWCNGTTGFLIHQSKLHLHHRAHVNVLDHRLQRMCQSTFYEGIWLWW